MNKQLLKNTITIILLIGALFVCLVNFGKKVELPYPLSFTVDDEERIADKEVNTAFREGVGGVTIDRGQTRAIFLNKDKEAVDFKDLEVFGDTVDYYGDVALNDKNVYLLTYERSAETGYIINQKIIRYDYSGNGKEIIWQKNYDEKQSKIINPRIFRFENTEDSINALYVDEDEKFVDIINIYPGNQDAIAHFDVKIDGEIVAVSYNQKANILGILSELGNLQLYKNNTLISSRTDVKPEILNIKIDDEGKCSLEENLYRGDIHLDHINFAAPLIFRTLLFWCSVLFIIGYALFKIVKKVKELVRKKQTKGILKVLAIAGSVLAILGMSLYYSISLIDTNVNDRIGTLSITAKNTKTFLQDQVTNKPVNWDDDATYLKIKNILNELRVNNLDAKYSIEYTLIYHHTGKINEGKIVASTYPGERPGMYYAARENEVLVSGNVKDDFAVYASQDNKGEILYAQQVVEDDNGNPICSILTTTDILMITTQILTNVSTLFVNLMVLIITIVLLIGEIRGFIASVKLRKKYRLSNFKNSEIAFSRTFSFLTTFVTSFDGALMVLIAKDIITQNDMSNSTFLLGIPPACISIGMTLGKPIFNFMSKRFNIKSLVGLFGILLTASYFLCFEFVQRSNFYGYCIAIFVSGLFTGTMTCIKQYMLLLSPDEQVRFEISQKNSLTGISGNIISVGLAGLIAEFAGSEYIYAMAIVPALMFLVLAICVFPNYNKYYMETGKLNKTGLGDCIKFLLSPAFLTFALFMLMTDTLTAGYKSFLFPLFTSDAGISKAMISNYVVFGNFLAFVVNRYSKNLVKKHDFLYISIFCTIATGLVFLSFIVNTTVAWAVLVIAITMILAKLSTMCNDMLWPRLCKKTNFPEQTCNKIILYFQDFIYMSRSMILSALLTMGIVSACAWLGGFMLIGAIIFFFVAKKTGYFSPNK